MEWIKCEESLPNHSQKIKFKGAFPFECEGKFELTPGGYDFIHITSSKKIYHIYGVTHWMPLFLDEREIT